MDRPSTPTWLGSGVGALAPLGPPSQHVEEEPRGASPVMVVGSDGKNPHPFCHRILHWAPQCNAMRFSILNLRARRAEHVVAKWDFDPSIWSPSLDLCREANQPELRRALEMALREWLICRCWAREEPVCNPSRLIDITWHTFRNDKRAEVKLRRETFRTLGRTEGGPCGADPESKAFKELIAAWKRSDVGSRKSFSAGWALDHRFGVEEPWGLRVSDVPLRVERRFLGGGGRGDPTESSVGLDYGAA